MFMLYWKKHLMKRETENMTLLHSNPEKVQEIQRHFRFKDETRN